MAIYYVSKDFAVSFPYNSVGGRAGNYFVREEFPDYLDVSISTEPGYGWSVERGSILQKCRGCDQIIFPSPVKEGETSPYYGEYHKKCVPKDRKCLVKGCDGIQCYLGYCPNHYDLAFKRHAKIHAEG